MSLRDVHGGRALILRMVLAELIAKRGTGPLAPRVVPRAQRPRPDQAPPEVAARASASAQDKEPA